MNRRQSRAVMAAALAAAAVSVVAGLVSLSSFGSAPSGDIVSPSMPAEATFLLCLGATVLLGLELMHRVGRAARSARASRAVAQSAEPARS